VTLYTFLLVFISLMSGAVNSQAVPSSRAVLASCLLVGGWVLLAHAVAFWLARRVLIRSKSASQGSEQLRVVMETVRWLAIPITLLCHFAFSLPTWLSAQPFFEHSMTLQAAGLLAPGMIVLLASWSAEYWYTAFVNHRPRMLASYASVLMHNLRGGPAWLIVPTLVFLALSDVAELVKDELLVSSEWPASYAIALTWGLIAGGGLVLAVAFPWLVRWIAKTEPLNLEFRLEIETWLQRCGISTHPLLGMQIARWDTSHRMLNAMVAGIVRPGRLLLLSDRLLDELPRGGRLMVVMHELAHVRRHHLLIRMVAILPAWLISSWSSSLLADIGLLSHAWALGVGGALGLIATVLTLGTVSHLSELDADATACRLAVEACQSEIATDSLEVEQVVGLSQYPAGEPMTVAMAADMLADALIRVTADHPAARKFSWLHPSLETRVERLRRIARPLPEFASDSHTLAV
tara:strand:- start:628 stop:2016 length:1389 start_codon:yes stop_codon:yes gene_type:complete